jgi:hypothetical protein
MKIKTLTAITTSFLLAMLTVSCSTETPEKGENAKHDINNLFRS